MNISRVQVGQEFLKTLVNSQIISHSSVYPFQRLLVLFVILFVVFDSSYRLGKFRNYDTLHIMASVFQSKEYSVYSIRSKKTLVFTNSNFQIKNDIQKSGDVP